MIARISVLLALLVTPPATALVHYQQGRLTIDGVQLLQTVEDPNAYQYLAGNLTLARNDAGDFQLLMVKYVGGEGEDSGGLLHALVRFALGPDQRAELAARLQERRPGAVLQGPVPMVPVAEGDDGGSFQIVSATLGEGADPGERISGRVIHSGRAPFAPGSRAAIAARLSPQAATLMWDSLLGATADLSVAVRGHYRARIEGYNAVVRAEVSTIYEHQSFIDNFQQGFTRQQVRDITDELIQSQFIQVEVFDQSAGMEIETGDMDRIVDLVTDKLIELVFDRKTGWAKAPQPQEAVEQGQICGRQERGFFSRLFAGATDDPYCSDDQYVIKDIKDITRRNLVLNLSQATTIEVPFDTAGNLGGFHADLEPAQRQRHFRIVPLTDPAFQELEVVFQLDGAIVDAFQDEISLVTVNLRRRRPDGSLQSESLVFDRQSVQNGQTLQRVTFHRLGAAGDDWRAFDYQVAWNLRGREMPLRVPPDPAAFLTTRQPGIQLTPPLERQTVTLDVDNTDFQARGVRAVVVQLASKIDGQPRFVASTLVRADGVDPSRQVTLFKDRGEPVVVRRIWHTRRGRIPEQDFQPLEGNYHFVFAPDPDWVDERAGGGP